jgi:diguanylate cyclase (GGDEF)-like protein/PAS domain S-box-containing protein
MINVEEVAVPAFTVSVEACGTFRYSGINAANTALTGITEEMRVGLAPHDCIDRDVADRLTANYRRCTETKSVLQYEDQLELPAGRFWWQTTLMPIVDQAGQVVQLFGICVDITERRVAENELRSAAFKDPLTGICNRRRFEWDLENAVARAKDTGRPFTLVLADVDRFKTINDTHGHGAGDAVLRAIAGRLAGAIRETDRLARIGGDEFAAIISAGSEGAISVAMDRMHRKLADPIEFGALRLPVGVSLGATLWTEGMSTTDITAMADAAMYSRKAERAQRSQ